MNFGPSCVLQQRRRAGPGRPCGPASAPCRLSGTAEVWRRTSANPPTPKSLNQHQVWTADLCSQPLNVSHLSIFTLHFPSVQEVQIGKQTLHEMIKNEKTKHSIFSLSGASSVRQGSRCWSPLLSVRDSSDRMSAVKRMQRSQSASPCRIPHPANGYLSVHGRVFASPDRSTTVAWGRNVSSTRR